MGRFQALNITPAAFLSFRPFNLEGIKLNQVKLQLLFSRNISSCDILAMSLDLGIYVFLPEPLAALNPLSEAGRQALSGSSA